jgi:hypothetical protein
MYKLNIYVIQKKPNIQTTNSKGFIGLPVCRENIELVLKFHISLNALFAALTSNINILFNVALQISNRRKF